MELVYHAVRSVAFILLLMRSSFTAKKAQRLVHYDKTSEIFVLDDAALASILRLPIPVKIISVFGEARLGKSTTLNFVRHNLDCDSEKNETEIEQSQIEEVFETGDSLQLVTYGIWMSVCEKQNIVLLDVQAINLSDDGLAVQLGVFASLISSGIVAFSAETIRNGILNFLYKVTRLSEHIFKGINESINNLGHLHVVIRNPLNVSSRTIFEDGVRDMIVKPSGEYEAVDKKRRAIAKYFHKDNITVSGMPLIGNRELLKDIQIKKNEEYWDTIQSLARSFQNFPAKTTLRSHLVDGEALVRMAKTLIKAMNRVKFGDNYAMVEKYLCDKSFQVTVAPVLKLQMADEIEQKKESVLKIFKDGCALTDEVNKVIDQLRMLIFDKREKEERKRQLEVAEEAQRKAEMEEKVAEKLRNEMKETVKKTKEEMENFKQAIRKSKEGNGLERFVTGAFLGAGLFALYSDARLKGNVITTNASKYEALGVREVTWTWNEEAEKIGLRGEARGVIAQEVEKLYPRAVLTGSDGYKRVFYKALDYAIGCNE